ncbi:MAG: aminotransferase class V-fold PLP-dependent enzyme [Coriobacteriia bacterium]|nr:aminotransferase class V-fold PLP-dependent enzyme [Coriobacteriia bacterium]
MASVEEVPEEEPRGVPAHYLDHAATSWPKPPGVAEAMVRSLDELGGNPGRGAYTMAMNAARAVLSTRAALAKMLGVHESRNIILTTGCTEGLNLVLRGFLQPGMRVVVSSMEHNAVSRPLHALAGSGVEVVVIDADSTGLIDPDDIEAAVSAAHTDAVVCLHVSNVSGTIQPIADLTDIAHAAGARMIVDGAQSVGHLPVDLEALGVDAWVASGHKGLLGPQGVGVLYLAPDFNLAELISGGTGSGASEEPIQPRTRPDRYEAGTRNMPGIAGLGAAIAYLAEHGDAIRAEEARLTRRLIEGFAEIPGVRVLGPAVDVARVPVVSIVAEGHDLGLLAGALDREFGIAVRSGLHCAPWAHRTLGTMATGALRFGLGWSTTDADLDAALEAMRELRAG